MSNDNNWIEEIGAPAYAGIAEMVAALNCDFERRDELRADCDSADDPAAWAAANPEDAAELAALDTAAGDHADRDSAEQRIAEDPLSIRVFGERVDGVWQADRVEVLLATGGPAVRVMAELDEHGEPSRAWLEVQDWGKPWTHHYGGEGSGETLLSYCQAFGSFAD
jgi:hypothetical protein